MKKLFIKSILVFLAFIIMPCITADAKLSADQVYIGGITHKSSMDSIIELYGKPHVIKSTTYYWGDDSLTVYTWDPAHGQKDYAVEIRCARKNGMATPAGVMVGMSENVLNQAYGKADVVDTDRNGQTVYTYFGEGGPCLVFRSKYGRIQVIEVTRGYFG